MLHPWLLLLLAGTAGARWAGPEDADHSVERQEIVTTVEADGSHVDDIIREILILKESGRSLGAAHFVYNPRSTDFEVIEAKTIDAEGQHPVPRSMVEDKPAASAPHGFDQHNQVLIAFPKANVGARLFLHYRERHRVAAIKGVFSRSLRFGTSLMRQEFVKLDSAVPLFVETNDPDRALTVAQRREGMRYILDVRPRDNYWRTPVDEIEPFIDGDRLAWVDVTTASDWADLARPVVARYEEILGSTLPPVFAAIAARAAAEPSVEAKLNAITSGVADAMHYMGDWRPINGGHVPRPLAAMAESRHGDCKDFSAAVAAIARRVGLKARVAWVQRGRRPVLSPNRLPVLSFNHAITRVDEGGKVYWLDGTNRASFAQGVPEDIIDRPALVLDATAPFLARIPAARPDGSVMTTRLKVDLGATDKISAEGALTLSGRAAVPMTGAELDRSTASVQYGLIRTLARESQLKTWKIEGSSLTTRTVRDIGFDFRFTETGPDLRTSAGAGYYLPQSRFLAALQVKTDDRVSDLFLGQPWTMVEELSLRRASVIGRAKLDCSVDSPWAKAVRKTEPAAEGLIVRDEFTLKRPKIRNAELRTPEFEVLRERLRACFDRVAVVYRPAGAKVAAAPAKNR